MTDDKYIYIITFAKFFLCIKPLELNVLTFFTCTEDNHVRYYTHDIRRIVLRDPPIEFQALYVCNSAWW
jgi:hypothetical protein